MIYWIFCIDTDSPIVLKKHLPGDLEAKVKMQLAKTRKSIADTHWLRRRCVVPTLLTLVLIAGLLSVTGCPGGITGRPPETSVSNPNVFADGYGGAVGWYGRR